MLNIERAERRTSARTLSAITAAFSESIDKEWFDALHDTREEAEVSYVLYKSRFRQPASESG